MSLEELAAAVQRFQSTLAAIQSLADKEGDTALAEKAADALAWTEAMLVEINTAPARKISYAA